MKNRWLGSLIILFLSVNGLFAQFPKYLYGITSWYGEEYRGKKTASGELFNPDAMTAAHRSLPFGSQIEVENLENGKKVIVVVNDRGPFVENRILDVSKAAAEQLGFLKKGTAYVKVVILRLGENKVDSSHENVESTQEARKKVSSSSKSESQSSSSNTNKISSESSLSSSLSSSSVSSQEVVSSSSAQSGVVQPQKTNVIHVVLEKTNVVYITNVVLETVTNGSLYSDRIVEKGLPEKVDSNLMVNLKDGFVDEEPLLNDENTVVDIMETPKTNKNAELPSLPETNQPVISSGISAPVTNQIVNFDAASNETDSSNFDDLIGFLTDESEVTPNFLLSNESALNVEKTELNDELSNELQSRNSNKVESSNENNLNEPVVDTNNRIDFPSDTNELEIALPEDVLSDAASSKRVLVITNQVVLTNVLALTNTQLKESNVVVEPSATPGINYAVQVGAFRKEGNALGLYDFLREKDLDVFTTEVTIEGKQYIRVRIGYYTSLTKAKEILRKVQSLHLPGMIVKIHMK